MLSHAWLRCMEDIQKRSHSVYALISDDRGPLAALAAPYLRSVEPLRILGGKRVAGALARLVLLATVPFYGGAGGLGLRSGESLERILPLLEPLLRGVCRRARRLALAVSNVSSGDLRAWRSLGYEDYELPPGAVLRLPGNYAGYLGLLGGRDRRELARIRRVAGKGMTTFEAGSAVDDDAELYELLCERYARHGVGKNDVELKPKLFRCLQRDFPSSLVVFRGRVRGELAGFMLGLHRGEELYLLFSGYRYELSRPNFVYFLLYDEAIRWSLEHGVRSIDAGTTMLTEKTRQGFSPARRWVCWRAASRPVEAALKALRKPIQAALPRVWARVRRED